MAETKRKAPIEAGDTAPEGGANCAFRCTHWCDECADQENRSAAAAAALERLEALEGWVRKNRCPDCDCPNRYCACVLMERVRGAEAERRKAVSDAATYRSLFQCAASLIAHNRDRLRRPRGEDEARVLAYLDEYGAPGLGPFWSGKTNGWVQPDMIATLEATAAEEGE